MLAKIERELICRALDRAGGNKASAARLLGMTRPRLYRRLTQLGLIDRPSDDESELESDSDENETPDFEVIEEPEEFESE